MFRPFHHAKAHFKLFSSASQTSFRARLQHLSWALYSQALRRYMLYHNPYFEVNATRKQGAWIKNYYEFCKERSIREFPLVKAVYSRACRH